MQSFKPRIFAIFSLLLFPIVMSFARSDDFKELLNSIDKEKYPDAGYVVAFDSTDVDVMDSGLSYVTMRRLVKVLDAKSALAFRQVDFDYDPLSADVKILSAKIHKKSGEIIELDLDRKVIDYPAPARMIYWGARKKTVAFGRLESGDAIETKVFRKGFTYALLYQEDDERFVPPMKGHYYDIVPFWSSAPIVEKVYRLALPEEKELQFEVYNGELESFIHSASEHDMRPPVRINPDAAQVEETGEIYRYYDNRVPGKDIYEWKLRDIKPFKGESDQVAVSDIAPKLLLSTSPDWIAKSVWFYGVNEDFGSFDVTPEVKKKTDELIAAADDELEKISILTHWVAENIRYSGISMGEGEGYTLHKGEMTYRDRCGVCKDKAGMLITMLRAAGFESYPAMTMAGSRIDKIPADQFNHSVSVAKLSDGSWILLDPTWVPGVRELWSSAEQQQQYLLGIPDGAPLMSTPISPPENHYLKIRIDSKLNENGDLTGKMTLRAEGQSDALIRRIFNRAHSSEFEAFFDDFAAGISPRTELKKVDFRDPENLSEPMKIEISFEIEKYAIKVGDRLIFDPIVAADAFSHSYINPELGINEKLEDRNYGFRVRCSKLFELEETIEVPRGYKVAEKPTLENVAPDRDDLSPTSFDGKIVFVDGKLTVKAEHVMGKRIYEAEDWPTFRASLVERKKLANARIVLVK